MNADDFEQQLRRQPMRVVPPAWRQEVLNAAQAGSPDIQFVTKSQVTHRSDGEHAQGSTWWRALLWPCPQAWAGVAAVWVVILGLHWLAGSQAGSSVQVTTAALSPERRAMLAEQQRLYVELLAPAEPLASAPHPKQPMNRPRSERKNEKGMSTSQPMKWEVDPCFV